MRDYWGEGRRSDRSQLSDGLHGIPMFLLFMMLLLRRSLMLMLMLILMMLDVPDNSPHIKEDDYVSQKSHIPMHCIDDVYADVDATADADGDVDADAVVWCYSVSGCERADCIQPI